MQERKPFTWGWFHKYRPIQSEPRILFDPYISKEIPTRRQTRILGQCIKCGKLKVKTIDGEWKIDEYKCSRT